MENNLDLEKGIIENFSDNNKRIGLFMGYYIEKDYLNDYNLLMSAVNRIGEINSLFIHILNKTCFITTTDGKLMELCNWEDSLIETYPHNYGADDRNFKTNESIFITIIKFLDWYELNKVELNKINFFLPEPKDENFDSLLYHESYRNRRIPAKHGYRLDILVRDEDEDVREEVAIKGYGHDILKDDESGHIRYMVIMNTTDKTILEYLSNDKDKVISDNAKKILKEFA